MSDSWGSGRFHDAEVTSIVLDRSGPALELTVSLDEAAKQETLLLRFEGTSDVELSGFNEQNALFDITVERDERGGWGVALSASYGLAGSFVCPELPELPTAP